MIVLVLVPVSTVFANAGFHSGAMQNSVVPASFDNVVRDVHQVLAERAGIQCQECTVSHRGDRQTERLGRQSPARRRPGYNVKGVPRVEGESFLGLEVRANDLGRVTDVITDR